MAVKHAYPSGKADGGDATKVRPTNWNADHVGDQMLDRSMTTQQVVSRTDEVSIYSFSIPANKMGSDGGVLLNLGGTILANVAGTLTVRVKLGATTILTSTAMDINDASVTYKFTLEILLMNLATNSQKCWANFQAIASVDFKKEMALLTLVAPTP